MNEDQIIIPEGWTYFAHRTNTARWKEDPFAMESIFVRTIMSAITEYDIHQDLRHYGQNHIQGYSIGEGEPFEIRCLICSLPYLYSLSDDAIKNIMLKEFYYDPRNFGGCRGQRHPSIPPKEELVVIGIGYHDEVFDKDKKIIWTIPRRLMYLYDADVKKGKIRTIPLQIPEDVKKI